MGSIEAYSNWVEVDLRAIESNVRWYCNNTGVQVMAVVKANGYGHGAAPCAFAAIRGGAGWCGVARIEEAIELRKEGIVCSILILGYLPPERLVEAISNQISFTVWEESQLERIESASRLAGKTARIHIKVDTGMSRLGIQPERAVALAKRLELVRGLFFEGIFTHFARAEERDQGETEAQEDRFHRVLEGLERESLRPAFVHAANSAAGLSRPSAYFNLIRAGISIYGLQPSQELSLPPEFKPALAWKTTLSQVKILPPGRGISYGHAYVTSRFERIGTLPVGYADGYRRWPGNQVLISGRRVPVIGRVCMDQMMVQLDEAPDASAGDEVILAGNQGEERITVEEIAQRWETINYEVVCGIGSRVPRVYV
jgi:alanine racemase